MLTLLNTSWDSNRNHLAVEHKSCLLCTDSYFGKMLKIIKVRSLEKSYWNTFWHPLWILYDFSWWRLRRENSFLCTQFTSWASSVELSFQSSTISYSTYKHLLCHLDLDDYHSEQWWWRIRLSAGWMVVNCRLHLCWVLNILTVLYVLFPY